MIKTISIILCLLLVNSVILAKDSVIAVVNDQVITQKDLNDFINFMRIQMSAQYSEPEIQQRIDQMLPDLIDRLIEDRLILQAAYSEDIIINQIQIETRVEQIKKNYSTEADFYNALIIQGLSLADLELKIKEQLLMKEIIDKKIKAKIVLRPHEITDYYFAHRNDFRKPEQRRVVFLKIQDPGLRIELQEKISEYKDLDTIAKRRSLEITDLGWVTRKQLKEDIVDIVFNLDQGKLTSYLNSNDEFYIFEVKEILPARELALSEVQEEIRQFLFEGKMQEALVEWLEELKSEAYIKIKGDYESS